MNQANLGLIGENKMINLVNNFVYDSGFFLLTYANKRFLKLTAFNNPLVECLSFLFFLKWSDKLFILPLNNPI